MKIIITIIDKIMVMANMALGFGHNSNNQHLLAYSQAANGKD